jgi:sugar phosphate permease
MICLAITLVIFWQMPHGYDQLGAIALFLVGFFVYGPQVLVGVASADFASKKAIGTANGFVGTMGYVGSALSGVGVGWLIDETGWSGAFSFFITASLLGSYLFFLTWNRKEGDNNI